VRCALALLCVGVACSAGELPPVAFAEQPGKVLITLGGRPLATYVYADPRILRPYLAHVRAPGGIQVTRNHPPVKGKDPADHATMHPGIWMAFGDINGHDFWRNKAKVKNFSVRTQSTGPGHGILRVNQSYHAQDSPKVGLGTEVCILTLLVRPAGTLILWESTFCGGEKPLVFGDQEEMGLGVRVATPMTEKNGGLILDAEGRKGARKVWGNAADWCDYSGTIDGKPVGVTLMCAPSNFRPSWFHARDYGLLVANPFGRKAMRKGQPSKVVVKMSSPLTLRYGILLRAGKVDLGAAYADYLEQISAERPDARR
jgi:hypothetical protein